MDHYSGTPEADKNTINVIPLEEAKKRLASRAITNLDDRRRQNEQSTRKELADVIPIDTKREKWESLVNIFKYHLSSLGESENPAENLIQADQTLQSIYENIPEINKAMLSAILVFYLSNSSKDTIKSATECPKLLQLIEAAANLDKTSEMSDHPAVRATRNRAISLMSQLPGEYNPKTGKYTPPSS